MKIRSLRSFFGIITISLLCIQYGHAQSFLIKGIVGDENGEPIPFVHLTVNNDSTNSFFTDISGRFAIRWSKLTDQISVSHVDYEDYKGTIKQLIHDSLHISLKTPHINDSANNQKNELGLSIIEKVVANDRLHDPERQGGTFKYSTYSKSTIDLYQTRDHKVSEYYKDVIIKDSLFTKHQRIKGSQHVEVIESMTERYFKYPKKDHEKIIGMRESGIHDKQLIALHSNQYQLTFYNNFYYFLGVRYASPIGPVSYKKYEFEELDRYYHGKDTIFVIRFNPIKLKTTGLTGLMYINSNQYAVQNIAVQPKHNVLVDFQITQQSTFVDSTEWFPSQINHLYFVDKYPKRYLGTTYEKKTYLRNIELNPTVDPDEFGLELVLMDHYATEQNEEFWESHRVEPLSKKETRTFMRVDTLRHTSTVHNIIDRSSAFYKGNLYYKLPFITLNNIFRLNKYEGVRLGLAGNAGKEWLKVFEFTGYVAYGIRDADWKWGAGGGFFLNEKKEMELNFLHRNDLAEPGHINYLDRGKDFFRSIFTDRMDLVETNKISFTFRSPGYHLFELGLETIKDQPTYDYQFQKEDENGNIVSEESFQITELLFSTRIGVNEKISNMLGNATRLTSFAPVFYLNYSKGYDGWLNGQYDYHKLSGLMDYEFHLGHMGTSDLTIDAGYISGQLPYPFLFNGKGSNSGTSGIIIKDHFQTMGLYEFVSDKYVNLFYSHNFGTIFAHTKFRPEIVIYQNIGWGSLRNKENHISTGVFPGTYGDGYFESGLGFNDIIKFNFFGKLYGGLGIGFFYRYGAHANPGGFSDNFAFRLTYVVRSI